MKTINGFQMYGMTTPVNIVDDEHGKLHVNMPLTEMQQRSLLRYLIDEGFIQVPGCPPAYDDYKLHPDLP